MESKIVMIKEVKGHFFLQIGRSSWNYFSEASTINWLFPVREVNASTYALALEKKLKRPSIEKEPFADMPEKHSSPYFWMNDGYADLYCLYRVIEDQ